MAEKVTIIKLNTIILSAWILTLVQEFSEYSAICYPTDGYWRQQEREEPASEFQG